MGEKAEDKNQVLSFLQAQLDRSKNDNETMQAMLNQMNRIESNVAAIESNVVAIKNNVNEKFEVVTVMVEEIRNDSKLRDHESHTLQQTVYKKSVDLAKNNYEEIGNDFKKIVGGYRRMIWSKLKIKFEVTKYIHIRRIDFQEALEFVKDFKPEDYFL